MASRRLQRWSRACIRWKKRLWLTDHDTLHMINDDPHPDDTSHWQNIAVTQSNPSYRTAKLIAHGSALDSLDDDGLNGVACHELLHVLLAPLDHACREAIDALPKSQRAGWEALRVDALERVTVHLENVLTGRGVAWTDKRRTR